MQKQITLLLVILSSACFASGDGAHHASITDLIAPFINVVILFTFLGIKLSKSLKVSFKNKSVDIRDRINKAGLKAKEATIMLEEQEKKIANLDKEIKTIFEKNQEDITRFESKALVETQEKISKAKSDYELKLKSEEKGYVQDLESEVFNKLLGSAKNKIAADAGLKAQVNKELLKGIN